MYFFFSPIIIAAAAVDQNQTVWTKGVTQENKQRQRGNTGRASSNLAAEAAISLKRGTQAASIETYNRELQRLGRVIMCAGCVQHLWPDRQTDAAPQQRACLGMRCGGWSRLSSRLEDPDRFHRRRKKNKKPWSSSPHSFRISDKQLFEVKDEIILPSVWTCASTICQTNAIFERKFKSS